MFIFFYLFIETENEAVFVERRGLVVPGCKLLYLSIFCG